MRHNAVGSGFEIFDRSGLPGTEFSNNVNSQRAVEGELARSIISLAGVQAARVHLVLPRYDLYSGQQPASAAVVLNTSYGGELTNAQVQGIAYLVSSAVSQLQPSQVTIVDANGKILNSPESSGSAGGLSTQQVQAERDYEQRLRDKLQAMLDQTVGPHKSIVQVQVALNFDTEKVLTETTEPLSGSGTVSEEYITKEEYKALANFPSGVAGITAPDYGITSGGESGSYTNEQEARKYHLSRIQKEVERAPGQISRLTIAAIIDSEIEGVSPRQIRDLLTAAAGIDPERGDTVLVEQMPIEAKNLAKEQADEAEKAAAAVHSSELTQTILRYGILLLLGVVFAGGIMMGSRQLSAALSQAASSPSEPAEAVKSRTSPTPSAQPESPNQPNSPNQLATTSAEYVEQLKREAPQIIAHQRNRIVAGSDD